MKKQETSSLTKTIKKSPYLSMLTLGALAIPLAIDTNLMPAYNMLGTAINDAMHIVPAVILTSFFYKWNKNRNVSQPKKIEPKTFGEKLQKENIVEQGQKDFKPSVAINSFLIVGATALGHALNNSFYTDMRINNYPIGLHMVDNLSPTILLSSIAMFGMVNLLKCAKEKLKAYNKDYSLEENQVVNLDKTEDLNSSAILKESNNTIDNIKGSINNLREKELETDVKFKPLT